MQVTVSCPVYESFRVSQVAGLFDVTLEEKLQQTFEVETPSLEEDWSVGLIVGPSGSGKSTLARKWLGNALYDNPPWPENRAVVDGFDTSLSIRDVTGLMTSVGFSSPPSWAKPYAILSNGEKFRCDLARALSVAKTEKGRGQVVVFDEFTSVVDRNVAKVASAAIRKGIRQGTIPCRFVAVTCHYDITEWLEPDWVIDMATGTLSRRCLRRPEITLEIVRCGREAWKLFARHHYLNGNIAPACRTYLGLWEDEPVAFCAILPVVCKKHHFRISRLVTLPDFQGMGIGMRFAETICELYKEAGDRINITGSHPSVIAHCKKSPLWKAVNLKNAPSQPRKVSVFGYRSASGRVTVSFEYIGKERFS